MARHVDVVLVPGHDLTAWGAKALGGDHEVFLWRTLARPIRRWLRSYPRSTRILLPDERIPTWKERQEDLNDRIRKLTPLAVVGLHHNGGGYPGSTALVPLGHTPSLHVAGKLIVQTALNLQIDARRTASNIGPDGVSRSWGRTVYADWVDYDDAPDRYDQHGEKLYPGGSVLYLLSELPDDMIRVIFEPFDGSVASDWRAAEAAIKSGLLAETIAVSIDTALQDLGHYPR